jgi:hypothetical protein
MKLQDRMIDLAALALVLSISIYFWQVTLVMMGVSTFIGILLLIKIMYNYKMYSKKEELNLN